jgi:hypothetical protein
VTPTTLIQRIRDDQTHRARIPDTSTITADMMDYALLRQNPLRYQQLFRCCSLGRTERVTLVSKHQTRITQLSEPAA